MSHGHSDGGAAAVGMDSMPYRELTTIDGKEVLRRWSAGQADRQIGRDTGIDRETVARYIASALRLGLVRGSGMTDDDAHAVAQCVPSRPIVAPSAEWTEIRATQ